MKLHAFRSAAALFSLSISVALISGCSGAANEESLDEGAVNSSDLTGQATVKIVEKVAVAPRLNELMQRQYGRQICAGVYASAGKPNGQVRQMGLWVQADSGFDRCAAKEYPAKIMLPITVTVDDEAIFVGPGSDRVGFLQSSKDMFGNTRKEVTLCAIGQCWVSIEAGPKVAITMVDMPRLGGGIRD